MPPPATPEEEPETYDLAFDPEEGDGEQPSGVDKCRAVARPAGGRSRTSRPPPPRKSPAPTLGPATSRGSSRSSDTRWIPRTAPHAPAEEPAAVSPAKAQARREEQRLRAAQELAEEDARKKKRNLIVAGLAVAAVVVLYVGWQFL